MKVGLIVICRYNSSRLPGKILKEINQKPLLSHILERLKESKYADNLVVATSGEITDDPIAAYCLNHKIPCFRGSLENVSQRFNDCMQHYSFDLGVRINGDNVFTDPVLIDEAVDLAIQENADFVSNVKDRTFPTGMSVEVVNSAFFKQSLSLFDEKDYQEHVTLYFYKHEELGNFHFIKNKIKPEAAGLKLAVDTAEDFTKAERIIKSLDNPWSKSNWKEIVDKTVEIEK